MKHASIRRLRHLGRLPHSTVLLCLLAIAGVQAGVRDQEATITTTPLSIGAFQEFGSVYNGLYAAGDATGATFNMEWVDHFGAFLSKEAIINDRLYLSGGIGGVFQFRKPETVGAGFGFHQRKAFFIGPARTEAIYHFGDDPRTPWLKLGAGMFPYKYNPDAANLGEYLFRSRAYPTTVATGGYVFINSAAATLEGLKAQFARGNFKADVLLTTETDLAPFYDWSLAVVASWKPMNGLFDLGAGVNFQHLIPVRPSRTSSLEEANSYLRDPSTGKYYVGNSDYYTNAADFYYGRETAADTARANAYAADGAIAQALFDLPDSARPSLKHYSARGTLLMARATVDPKKLLDLPILGPEDLKIYAEIDVLGVKNYPVYYENISERMPIMFGFNFPACKVLDLLALQVEYFNSPWLNNNYSIAAGNNDRVNNTPYLPIAADETLSRNSYNDQADRDNWKWSVLARKGIAGRVTVSAQVARDHLRLPSSEFYYGPQYDPNEVTAFPGSWYWATQISWGL